MELLGMNGLNLSTERCHKVNLIIILDISVEESMSRNSNPDVNEQDENYLRKVRSYFIKYANAYGWKIVDANNKSKEEIHGEVTKIVSDIR